MMRKSGAVKTCPPIWKRFKEVLPMNQRARESRELSFACPKCGGRNLFARTEEFVEIDHVNEDGHIAWGGVLDAWIMDYYCQRCEEQIKVDGKADLISCLIANCNQDESDAVKDREDDSGFLFDDES
jgi:hypothetical protein